MKEEIRGLIRGYYDFWREISVLYADWAKANGLTYDGLFILYALWDHPDRPVTQKMICQEWVMPKQTVNTILKAWLREGLVRLERVPQDQRSKAVLFTEKGKAWSDGLLYRLSGLEERTLLAMDPEDRLAMARGNSRFLRQMKREMERSL